MSLFSRISYFFGYWIWIIFNRNSIRYDFNRSAKLDKLGFDFSTFCKLYYNHKFYNGYLEFTTDYKIYQDMSVEFCIDCMDSIIFICSYDVENGLYGVCVIGVGYKFSHVSYSSIMTTIKIAEKKGKGVIRFGRIETLSNKFSSGMTVKQLRKVMKV